MQLFTRDAILFGPPGQTRQWATDVAGAFASASGKDVSVWTSIAGGKVGHYVWSRQVEGIADVATSGIQALTNEAYLAEVEKGMPFVHGPATDTIYLPVNELPADTTRPGNVASIVQATARASALGSAIEWGMKALDIGTKVTGLQTVLLTAAAGPYSTLTWMTVTEDAASADAANQKLMADPGYIGHLANGTEVFVDGSANTQLFLRVG